VGCGSELRYLTPLTVRQRGNPQERSHDTALLSLLEEVQPQHRKQDPVTRRGTATDVTLCLLDKEMTKKFAVTWAAQTRAVTE